MAESIFERDGDLYVPSEFARGPWDPNALHGGPVTALFANEFESSPSEAPTMLTRVTVELVRPVPMAPLRIETRVRNAGRKVQRLDAAMFAGEVEVARATGLRNRVLSDPLDDSGPADPPPPRAEPKPLPESFDDLPDNFGRANEWRPTKERDEYGPDVVWFRLQLPMIDGLPTSPWMRAAAAGDFGNGVSTNVDWMTHTFINPDLTIYLHRLPVGDWICLDARTWSQPDGIGLAGSVMYDETGPIGQALQSVLLERR